MKRFITILVGSILLLGLTTAVFAQDDPTVYITRTGTKYHSESCSSLRKSAIPMKLSEASQRYSPCSRCNPPTATSSGAQSESNITKTQGRTNTGSSAQCLGITKKGLQCKRTTSDPSGYCYQHVGQASSGAVIPSNTTSTSGRTSSGSRVQCNGITKKGARCKRMTSDPSGYCYQHNK